MPSLQSVTAQIKNSAGTTVKTVTSVLNGGSYDLSKAKSALSTSGLAPGNYNYSVSVKVINTSESIRNITLQSNDFTVVKSVKEITGVQKINIKAPSYNDVPAAVSDVTTGTGFKCRSIAWTPSASKFAANTDYSAAVVLEANDGYGFV